MSIRCALNLHAFDHRTERVELRGRIKVTTVACSRCGVRRGWVDRLDPDPQAGHRG